MCVAGGGGGGACDNHNVNNVKIHTYIMASRLRSIHLNTSSHLDDMTVLFVQAVNDSRTLTYIVENFLNLRNTNSKTSTLVLVNIPLKQMPFIK